jgi:hypothetical protein
MGTGGANQKGNPMRLSPETISKLNDIASLVLILSLIVGAVATVAVTWTSKQKEQALANELQAASAEAAKAQADLGTLRGKVSPRHLTQNQMGRLISALQRIAPRTPTIQIERLGDAEAASFADDFIMAVNTAGIPPRIKDVGIRTPPAYGLGIVDTSDGLLIGAVTEAGIAVSAINTFSASGTPTIVVNLKLPR